MLFYPLLHDYPIFLTIEDMPHLIRKQKLHQNKHRRSGANIWKFSGHFHLCLTEKTDRLLSLCIASFPREYRLWQQNSDGNRDGYCKCAFKSPGKGFCRTEIILSDKIIRRIVYIGSRNKRENARQQKHIHGTLHKDSKASGKQDSGKCSCKDSCRRMPETYSYKNVNHPGNPADQTRKDKIFLRHAEKDRKSKCAAKSGKELKDHGITRNNFLFPTRRQRLPPCR